MTSFSESPITSLCCIILLRQPQEFPLFVPVDGQTVGEDLFDGEVKRRRVAHDLLNDVRRKVDQAQGFVEEGTVHRFFFGNRHGGFRRILFTLVKEMEAKNEPPLKRSKTLPFGLWRFGKPVQRDQVAFAANVNGDGDFDVAVDKFLCCA